MLAVILVVGSTAFAQDLNFNQYRKFLMSGNNTSRRLAIETTCTNSTGQTFKIGEKSYDLCLIEASANPKKKPANPGSTTTIHIGN